MPTWDWGSPFDEFERIRRQMDRLSDVWTRAPFGERAAGVFPFISVAEDKGGYYARAELSGIKAEELDISVTGNSLSITGERKIAAENEKARYHRREREAGTFSRVVTLPAGPDRLNQGRSALLRWHLDGSAPHGGAGEASQDNGYTL